jgi:hypothetical protein
MDPEGATKWVASLSHSPDRDQAAQSLINNLIQHDTSSAVRHLELINDPQVRVQTQQRIAHQWLRNDPAAARRWIQTTDLPLNVKNQLLQINPDG